MFYAIFDFNKLRYKSLEELKNSSEECGTIFAKQIASDGFAIDFQFARKSNKGMITVDAELLPSNFTAEEINDHFKPCAVDPGRSQMLTAAYGYENSSNEIQRGSAREYYTYTGLPLRQKKLEAEKKESGIDNMETKLETGKTQNIEAYGSYVRYQQGLNHAFTITRVASVL
ncbi:hypothetical protein DFQ30_006989 [Apophysomyces sp. BC1015]|nr:hypothetical protein DFQ30_006989 [Apophysomyces sp. BC1015]